MQTNLTSGSSSAETALCVDPDRIDEMWPHVAQLIERGSAVGGERTEDILEWLYQRIGLLWIVWGAEGRIVGAVVSRLIKDRRGIVCQLGPAAGDMLPRWASLHDEIEAYARRENCVALRIVGRPGWERRLDGYRRVAVTLEKML